MDVFYKLVLLAFALCNGAATGVSLAALREERSAAEFKDIERSILDAGAALPALQVSAASILWRYVPDRVDPTLFQDNLWTPVGRNTSLKYAWTVRERYLSPLLEGRRGTLRSTTLFAAGTLWHVELVFDSGPSGCGADPSAPVRLQLAPTLGSLLWHEEDAVTLEGRLELPGAPEGAGWRRHAFVARVTKHSPASLPGLTCGRLRQAMSGDTLYVNAYIDDVTMHWHADSRHVEAQIWRGSQKYFTTTALASRLGLLPRLQALNVSHALVPFSGATGRADITVLYRHGAEASDNFLQVLRRLLYDNVACHVRGDGGAAAHKFCELQRSALWPQQAGLGSGELLRLLSPCQDKRAAGGARSPSWSSPPPQPPPAGPSGPLAAASFNAGPACDGLDGSTEFDSVLGALLKAKGKSLATGPTPRDQAQLRRESASGQADREPSRAHVNNGRDYFPTALLALALTASAWHVGRTVFAGAAKRGARLSSSRRGLAAADTAQARGGRAPSRPARTATAAVPKRGSQPPSQRAEPRAPVQPAPPPQPSPQHQQQVFGCPLPAQPSRAKDLPSPREQLHAPPPSPLRVAAGKDPVDAQPLSIKPTPVAQQPAAPARRRRQREQATSEHQVPAATRPPATPPQPSAGRPAADMIAPMATAPAEPQFAASASDEVEPDVAATRGGGFCSGAGGGDGGCCLVCLDRPWQHGFLHGGSVHIGVCGECLAALQAAGRGRGAELSCPVCRGRVERTVALFA